MYLSLLSINHFFFINSHLQSESTSMSHTQLGSAAAACPGPCPAGFSSYLHRWKIHSCLHRWKNPTFLGNLFQCSTVKKFSCIQIDFHVFQFVPTASCALIGHPGMISFFIRYLGTMLRYILIPSAHRDILGYEEPPGSTPPEKYCMISNCCLQNHLIRKVNFSLAIP